jgi:hypothetical protein
MPLEELVTLSGRHAFEVMLLPESSLGAVYALVNLVDDSGMIGPPHGVPVETLLVGPVGLFGPTEEITPMLLAMVVYHAFSALLTTVSR